MIRPLEPDALVGREPGYVVGPRGHRAASDSGTLKRSRGFFMLVGASAALHIWHCLATLPRPHDAGLPILPIMLERATRFERATTYLEGRSSAN